MVSDLAFVGIGAMYLKTVIVQQLGKSAHADTADSDEIYICRMVKVNLIHNKNHAFLLYIICNVLTLL